MTEYEFLRRMFHRLHEMADFASRAKGAERDALETGRLAVECSIRNYLDMRQAERPSIKESSTTEGQP